MPLAYDKHLCWSGLYANINVGKSNEYDEFYSAETAFHTEALNFGEIVEMGMTTAKDHIKMDFNISYQIHNSAAVKFGNTKLYGNTLCVNLSIGYIL